MKAMKAILAAISTAALLAGCNNTSQNIKVDPDDHTINVDGIEVDLDKEEKDYKANQIEQLDYVFDTTNKVSEFGISFENGSMEIEYSGDDKIGFSLDYTVYADTEEICQEVRSHVNAIAETNDNRIEIRLIDDETKEDITAWLQKNNLDCRIEYDYYITVPKFISSFDIKGNAGDLRLNEIKGQINGDVKVGNINCSDLELTGPSKINCDVGSIIMSSCTYKADTDISVKSGYISYCLPLSGSDGADINVGVDAGQIKVTGIKNYEVKDEKKKKDSHSLDIAVENCNVNIKVDSGEITINKE